MVNDQPLSNIDNTSSARMKKSLTEAAVMVGVKKTTVDVVPDIYLSDDESFGTPLTRYVGGEFG